jgi:hypothetical protein
VSRSKIYKIYLRADNGNDIHIIKNSENDFEVYTVNEDHVRRAVTMRFTRSGLLNYLDEILGEMQF